MNFNNNNIHLSKRKYKVAMIDRDGATIEHLTVQKLLLQGDAPYEYINALAENIDTILDMQIGFSMYFQPNRDDSTSKGIIVRVQ